MFSIAPHCDDLKTTERHRSAMDANTLEPLELARQTYQQIRETVEVLAERYGQRIIADCRVYVEDSAIAQALAEEVIVEAVMNLGNYKGDNLEIPLRTTAVKMAKAKRASMRNDRWKTDQGNQELEGKTVEEREDFALVRFRKRTDFTWKQIAEIMGMTDGQARVRCHRALLKRPELKNVR
jgi:DNA-directed RNA polymerase specialized sigma24 family protein